MQLAFHHSRLLAAFVGLGLLIGACSSNSPEPEAVSLDEYFERVQSLHDLQESQSEAMGQRFEAQLTGSEANLEEVLAAVAEILPEFFPEFRAVLNETRDGLAEITPPAEVASVHADLITAYADFDPLIEGGLEELEAGQPPIEVLNALFVDRSSTELGQRFAVIADQMAAIAQAAGIEDFVGAARW